MTRSTGARRPSRMVARSGVDIQPSLDLESLKHLAPSAQSLSKRGNAERLASLAEDRWFDYAHGRPALVQMPAAPQEQRLYGQILVAPNTSYRAALAAMQTDDLI